MTLTKANILEAVAEQSGYPKKQSFKLIEILLEIIKKTLNKDGTNITKANKNKKESEMNPQLPSLYSIFNI